MNQEGFVIFPPYEVFYMESMLFITESALRSVKAANEDLQKMDDATVGFSQDKTLNHLQNVIVQGAALSKYFWPPTNSRDGRSKEHKMRGEALQSAFDVIETSPLKSRDLRNEIEHFDEKLDNYLASGIAGHIIPHYIGPFADSGGIPCHYFRAYYTDQGIFEVLGKRYVINPIVAEIARIHKLLEKACTSEGRLPKSSR